MAYRGGARRNASLLPLGDQPKMIHAILKGDIPMVKHLISNGEDVNAADLERRTYLHLAAAIGATEISKLLLEAGARVNSRDNEWLLPLHRACKNNRDDVVQVLLDYGADPNTRDRNLLTALHVSAANNALESLKLFFKKVSNVDITDRSGATALHHAAFNGHCDIIAFLLKKQASPNAFDKNDRRALHYAAATDNTDAIRLLVQSGGEINAKDKELMTPLHIAAAKGYLNSIQILIELKANVNAVDKAGNTPLHWACLHGQDDVIDELIAFGADINSSNHMGITPLHLAAASTTGTPALEVLIRHREAILINAKDKFNRTPLHLAAKYGRISRVHDLLRCGANINYSDKDMKTALHYAARGGHSPVVEALIAQPNVDVNILDRSGMTPLHHAAFSGVSDICQRLLNSAKPSNPLIHDVSGRTPHFLAALTGKVECLKIMLPLPDQHDTFNRTPLHYAAAGGDIECLQFLIEQKKYNVNHMDIFGRLPLHYASAVDDDGQCVGLLLEQGSNVRITDKEGYYPLNYAAVTGKLGALRKLAVLRGVRWNKIRFKICPAHCAAFNGHSECLEFLLKSDLYEDLGASLEYATIANHTNCLQVILNFATTYNAGLEPNKALHLAVLNSLHDCFEVIVVHITNIDVIDHKSRTPLMLASLDCKKNYNCIDLLLKKKANVNAVDDCKRSVLFYVAFSGHEDSVRGFLDRGANVLHRDNLGKTALHIAASMGHSDVLHSLINALVALGSNSCFHESFVDKDRFTPLHWASLNCQHNAVTILLENSKLRCFYGSKISPLHLAALMGSHQCMELLISHFGPEIIHLLDSKKRSVLHYVCMSKVENKSSLLLLLKYEANINSIDQSGCTPLLYACKNGHSNLVSALLESGADCTIADSKENNALHLACLNSFEMIGIRLLEKCPSLVSTTNCDLKTPLHLSASAGLIGLTQQLLLAGASVNSSDSDDFTPSQCCAKSPDVADCLQLIESIMLFEESLKPKRSSLGSNQDNCRISAGSERDGSPFQLYNTSAATRLSLIKRKSAQLFAASPKTSPRDSFVSATSDLGAANLSSVTIINNEAPVMNNISVEEKDPGNGSDSDFY